MTIIHFSELREKGRVEGGSSSDEPLPVGQGYFGEIIKAGAKAKPNGFLLWWTVQVLVGPDAGRTGFLSQQLNTENGKQLNIFFRVCGDLGIDFDVIPDGTPPESIAKLILGTKINFDITHNPSKTDPSKVFSNFTNIKRVTSEPAPVAVGPAAYDAPSTQQGLPF